MSDTDDDVAQLRKGMARLQGKLQSPGRPRSSSKIKTKTAGRPAKPPEKSATGRKMSSARGAKSSTPARTSGDVGSSKAKPASAAARTSAVKAKLAARKAKLKSRAPEDSGSSFVARVQTVERHKGLVSQLESVTRDLKLLSSGLDDSIAQPDGSGFLQGELEFDPSELDSFLLARRKGNVVEAGRRLMDDCEDDSEDDEEFGGHLYFAYDDLLQHDEQDGMSNDPMTPELGAPSPSGHTFRRRSRRAGTGSSHRCTPSSSGLNQKSGGRAWRSPQVKPRGDIWGTSASVVSASSAGSASGTLEPLPPDRSLSPLTPIQLTTRIPWRRERSLDTSLEEEYFASVLAQSAARVRHHVAACLEAA